MADTPKSSSPENPILDSKKSMTFGDLYTRIQSESILTPEQEVALRKKAVDKYGMLGLIQKRKETIGDNTRTELEELLADMPGKSDILAKLEGLLPGKSKTVEVAKDATKKATELAKSGVEGAKNLTPENMQAAASKLGDKFSAGTAVLATAGAAVMAAPTIEGKAKALDGVMSIVGEGWEFVGNFFNNILAAIAAFFSGKFSESLDKLKGAFGMGEKKDPKTLAEEAKKKGEETIQKGKETITKGSESVENYGERMKQKYWDSLIAEGWIKDPKAQKTKFEALWTEYGSKMKKASKETYDMVSGSKNGVLGEQVFNSSQASLSFLVSLVSKGIIPTEALQVKIGDGIQQGIEIGLKSTKSLILGSPMDAVNMLGQFGSSDFEALSPVQRRTILSSVHHSMAVPLYMTGLMSKLVAKTALFGIYYDHGIGFSQAGAIGNSAIGQYDASAKKMNDLLTMLGESSTHINETKEYAQVLRNIVSENQTKAQVMQIFLKMRDAGKSGVDIATAIEGLNIEKSVLGTLLTELRTSGTERKAMTGVMGKFLENSTIPKIMGIAEKWKKSISGTVVMTHDMQSSVQSAIEASNNTGKRMAEVVRSDISIVKVINDMRLGVSQAETMAGFDKGIMAIKVQNANDAKAVMDRYVRSIPKGFETFFSGLAVSLTIADVGAAQPGEGESWLGVKMKTLMDDIITMNPLVAGYKMVIEGTTMENGTFTKYAYVGFGGTIFAVGAYDLARLISSPSWAGASRLALGPIHTVGSSIVGIARGGRLSMAAGQALFRPGALTSFRTLKAVGSYATIAGIGYLMYDYQSKKNDVEGMKQAGMLDEKGNIDPTKIKEGFAALPEDKKSGAVKHILDNMFGNEKVNIDVSDMKNITVDSQRTGADGVPMGVDTLSHIREVIASLGISDPRVFLSTTSVKNIKTYIQSLPIADEMKTKFAGEYGIDLQKA